METKHCSFWLPNKNRFCANTLLNGSLFCGNHNSRPEGQWIQCPVDPSHSVLEQNLNWHVKRCPLLKQVQSLSDQPFYQKGINSGSDGELQEEETSEINDSKLPTLTVSSEMKRNAVRRMSVPEFCNLIEKVESIHESLCKDIEDSFQMPDVCSLWIKSKEEERKLPFQEKHIMQQASIVGNLENFGVLKNSLGRKQATCEEPVKGKDDGVSTVIEFGAGRGYLTQMLADCYGISRVFLIERKAYKLKADRSLRQNESLTLERLRIDIEDLNLNAVESLQGVPFLATGKHLCGPATDQMPVVDVKLLKLTQEGRKRKIRAKSKLGPQGSDATAQQTSTAAASPQPTIDLDADGGTPDSRRAKKQRDGNVEGGSDGSQERGFTLPPCVSEPAYFDRFPLEVSPKEIQAIERMNPESRAKKLAEDSASVIRVLEMAHVLARGDSVSAAELKKAQGAQKAAEDKASNIKIALDLAKDKLQKKMEELARKADDWEKEKKKLIEDQKAEWEPAADEPEDVKLLDTRAKFVGHIQTLKDDCLGMAQSGFNLAIQQLSILNPGLVTEGAGIYSQIVDGKLVPEEAEEDEEVEVEDDV